MQRPLIDVRDSLSRREFLIGAAGVGLAGAGVVLLGACGSDSGKGSPTSTPGTAAEPPPETTTIRLVRALSTCFAPLYLAEPFLLAEGFTNVQYVEDALGDHGAGQLAKGEVDMSITIAAGLTVAIDRADKLVVLAGVGNTCFEVFASDRVQTLRDLKGKRISVYRTDATDPTHLFIATLLAYEGIDLKNEVEFVPNLTNDAPLQLKAGTIDAALSLAPFSKLYKTQNIGHAILDGMNDPPWSQYFCCMATANRDFAEQHPVATKRALRAILKATDVCAREPERAARYLVDNARHFGFPEAYTQAYIDYDDALAHIKMLAYSAWRDQDPADTLRFYALRLREAGLVEHTPEALVARATDWRYLNEIKRELAV